jgi:hypothetical protein
MMNNPISDADSNQWWRENLGNLSLDEAITMIQNGQKLPWKRPRGGSDWEELSFHFQSTGTSIRHIARSDFASDQDDLEDYPFTSGSATINWFDFYSSSLMWSIEDKIRTTGFRLVRSK